MAACAVPALAACVSWYAMLRYADTDAQLTAADSLIVPLEFQLYGYCRCRRVSDVCEPGGYEPPMVKNAQQFPG